MRDTSYFTVEVPKQLTRDQYFTFFDKFDFGDISVPEVPHRVGQIPPVRGKRKLGGDEKFAKIFVKKLFSEMLRKDEDSQFYPDL